MLCLHKTELPAISSHCHDNKDRHGFFSNRLRISFRKWGIIFFKMADEVSRDDVVIRDKDIKEVIMNHTISVTMTKIICYCVNGTKTVTGACSYIKWPWSFLLMPIKLIIHLTVLTQILSHNSTRKSERVSSNRKDRQRDIKIDRRRQRGCTLHPRWRRGTTERHTDVDDNDPAAKKVDGL